MFERMGNSLDGYIEYIIISFLDNYKNVRNNIKILNPKTLMKEDYKIIGENFAKIAKKHNMTVQTCFGEENLVEYRFIREDCITQELATFFDGILKEKDKNNVIQEKKER